MQNVVLLGEMGQEFGETWSTDCDYVVDVFKHIGCQRPNFRKYLIDAREKGMSLLVARGDELLLTPEEIFLSIGNEDIAMAMIPEGAGPGTLAQIGDALYKAYEFYSKLEWYYQLAIQITATIAINLAITAITNWLAPGDEQDDSPEGYLFQGTENMVKEGIPIPVLYGELIVGGAVINATYTNYPIKSFEVEPTFDGHWDSGGDNSSDEDDDDEDTEQN